MEFVLRIVPVPSVAPAEAGAMLEAKGDDFLHQRQKEALFRQFLHAGGIEELPHFLRNRFISIIFACSVALQHFINGNRRRYLRHVLIVALVAVSFFLIDQLADSLINVLLNIGR